MVFIGAEERQLAQTFGKPYADYLACVDWLIPYKSHDLPSHHPPRDQTCTGGAAECV